jgi:acetyl esterase/lipase
MVPALLATLAPAAPVQPQPGESRADRHVVYASREGWNLTMALYYPPGGPEGGPYPAVVMLHRGSFMAGRTRDIEWLSRKIAEQGMVAAAVQYRLAPRNPWPRQLEDAAEAVRYLRVNAETLGVLSDRVGAAGEGAGGTLAMHLGYSVPADARVRAVLALYAPADFTTLPERYTPMISFVFGRPYAGIGEPLVAASPVHRIGPDAAPTFLIHGQDDQVVPVAQARAVESALRQARVPVQLATVRRMRHGIIPGNRDQMAVADRGVAWMRQELGR